MKSLISFASSLQKMLQMHKQNLEPLKKYLCVSCRLHYVTTGTAVRMTKKGGVAHNSKQNPSQQPYEPGFFHM